MHQGRRMDDRASVDVTDRLQPEAHAEDSDTALRKHRHDRANDAGILGSTRAGGKQYRVGVDGERLLDGHLIIAHNDRLSSEFAKVLNEVVDEAVVAVDDQNPR